MMMMIIDDRYPTRYPGSDITLYSLGSAHISAEYGDVSGYGAAIIESYCFD
jgi:hypothetical protein